MRNETAQAELERWADENFLTRDVAYYIDAKTENVDSHGKAQRSSDKGAIRCRADMLSGAEADRAAHFGEDLSAVMLLSRDRLTPKKHGRVRFVKHQDVNMIGTWEIGAVVGEQLCHEVFLRRSGV